MAGEHHQPAITAEQQLHHFLELFEVDVLSPGVEADHAGGEEHFHEEHHHLLHAAPGDLIDLPLAHLRKAAAKVRCCSALAMFFVDAVEGRSHQLGGLQIGVHRERVHRDRREPNGNV